LVLVLLHTQTFCAFAAATAGSWLVKATSVKPVSWTRLGTDALIDTVPLEVAPSDPCVAADAATVLSERIAARVSWRTRAFNIFIPHIPKRPAPIAERSEMDVNDASKRNPNRTY
jgi:hypothetical protein